jgi:hypothetical protein
LTALASLFVFAAPASGEYIFNGSFSGPGSEAGQIDTPGRAAVEQSTGNLFVVDSGNDRVQVFAPNGPGTAEPLTAFGSDSLSEPWGIAIAEVAGQTSIYVADAGNDRILKYDSDEAAVPGFTLDAAFVSPVEGSGPGEVGDFKAALAVDPGSGDLLLADTANQLIQRFEADGTFASAFDGSNGASAFAGPIDVAVNSSGDVYVIDASGDIANAEGTSKALRYSGAGVFKAQLGPVGTHERVATITVNPGDDSVVVSGDQDAVYEAGPPPFLAALGVFDSANQALPSPSILETALYDSVSGLAIDAGTGGRLYVVLDSGVYFGTRYGSPEIQVFGEIFPPRVTIDPVDPAGITGNEALIEGSVNPNGLPAEWRLRYRVPGAAGWVNLPVEQAGSGTAPTPISVQLTGLLPKTGYEAQIVASNSDGTSNSPAVSFSTVEGPPAASVTFASGVAQDEAWLNGGVNPFAQATTYRFEYGTQPCDATQCTAVPAGSPDSAGTGMATKRVAVRVRGLQAGTTYHFRLVAENANGTKASAEQAFSTLAPGDAPYGWELVSPAEKHGGQVLYEPGFLGGGGALSPDGSRVAYTSRSTLVGDSGAPMASTYVAARGSESWDTRNVTPRLASSETTSPPQQAPVRPLSEDLTKGVVQTNVDPLTHQRTGRQNLYFRDFDTDEYRLLTPDAVGATPEYSISTVTQQVFDWTPALSHIVFVSTAELTADAVGIPGPKAYVIPTSTGKPDLASIVGGVGSELGGALLSTGHNNENALSDDGSRLFFETSAGLHMRDLAADTTIDLPGAFADATPDGRFVFVVTDEPLVGEDGDSSDDLYRIGTDDPGDPLLVSADQEPADGDAGHGGYVLAATPDGSRAYFLMAGSQLVDGAPTGRDQEIYLWDEDEGLSYVVGFENELSDQLLVPSRRGTSVDTNASGDTLVVNSRISFLADQGPGPDPMKEGTMGGQVYVYEKQRSTRTKPSFKCVSCLPGPGLTNHWAMLDYDEGFGMFRTSSRDFVTEEGTAVFQTRAALVPTDTNGANYDVYRYREGVLELVSSGRKPLDSYLFGASSSGTIAFATSERLTAWDFDGSTDAYVARPGGGFADPPAAMVPCSGDDCQAPWVPPLAAGPPPSSTLSAAGNPKPKRPKSRCTRRGKAGKGAAKARAGKRGTCEPKHSKKSRNTKTSNKRGEK